MYALVSECEEKVYIVGMCLQCGILSHMNICSVLGTVSRMIRKQGLCQVLWHGSC